MEELDFPVFGRAPLINVNVSFAYDRSLGKSSFQQQSTSDHIAYGRSEAIGFERFIV
jgi:hypothetical protein